MDASPIYSPDRSPSLAAASLGHPAGSSSSFFTAALFTGLLLSFLGSTAEAQETSDADVFSETIDVELVNVDIWVQDRQGDPIRGLQADAFRVLHNGQEVELTNFSELGPGPLVTEGGLETLVESEPQAIDTNNFLVLYLDQLRLQPRDYGPTVEALRGLVNSPGLVPEQVLLLRQGTGLFVEAHLGTSRRDLLKALDRFAREGDAAALQNQTELDQILTTLRREWRASKDLAGARGNAISSIPTVGAQNDGARGAIGGGTFGPDACDVFVSRVGSTIDGYSRSQARQTSISLEFLSRTATFLAGLPGVKTLLYVGGGLETNPGSALTNYVSGLCPGGESLFAIDSLEEEMSTNFFRLTRHFNSNRITIYPFQTGTLGSTSTSSAASEGSAGAADTFRAQGAFEQRRRSQSAAGLGVLADETGGRLISRPDQVETLAERLRSRYSMAYSLPASQRGDEIRIKVEVDAENSLVRHRRSFLAKTPDQRLAELVDGALFLGLVENSLDVGLGLGEMKRDAEAWLVPLHIFVPAGNLTFEPSATPATELKVHTVARHLGTGEISSEDKSFRIKQPTGAVIEPGARAQLPMSLRLAEGPYSIAVGIRDEVSGLTSVVSTSLEAREPAHGGPGGGS